MYTEMFKLRRHRFNFRYAHTKKIRSELIRIEIKKERKMLLKGVIEIVIKGDIKGDWGGGEARFSVHIRGTKVILFYTKNSYLINIYNHYEINF